MGRAIEQVALERGHTITARIDRDDAAEFDSSAFKSSDVAIEFTMPDTALDNISKALKRGVSVVCGTTGWLDKFDEACELCRQQKLAFIYASNFSPGVNIFFHINRQLAGIMKHYPDYRVSVEEIHHVHKKDAPSGTAITIAEDILKEIPLKKWSLTDAPDSLHITAVRKDETPGTHVVEYENDIDVVHIRHEAKNRKGFALGAVLAAEFIEGKTGVFTMNDVLKLNEL
jgi:4-hydroxy-tetrahydrodipicolinate reductase